MINVIQGDSLWRHPMVVQMFQYSLSCIPWGSIPFAVANAYSLSQKLIHYRQKPFAIAKTYSLLQMCKMSWQAHTTPEYVVGFLALVIILLLQECLWVNALFLMISWPAAWKFDLVMIVAVLGTSSISLRFGTAGWYQCVTKGKIRFFVLFHRRRACVLPWNFTSESVLLIEFRG